MVHGIGSAEAKGTRIILFFPSTREPLSGEKPQLAVQEYMGNGEPLLVVDDVKEQRAIVTRMLEKIGYSVRAVSSGEEAVDYLKNNPVDLLILDMIMEPGIDGLETCKRVLEFRPEQKAIITIGFSETNRVKEAQSLGVGAYIKKPFLLEQIGEAVKAELDK